MALAGHVSSLDRHMEGSAARALPLVDREPRTASKPAVRKAKHSWSGLVFGGLGWLVVLGLSFFVVYRNSLVMTETSALTGKQETLNRLDQEIREKSSRTNVSIEDVQRYAEARNMKRATTVKTVAVDQNAAAPVVEPGPVAVAAEPARQSQGLFGAVKGFFARFTAAKGAAGVGGN